jgi:hypothetical protein
MQIQWESVAMGGENEPYKVTGLWLNFLGNSHLEFDMLASLADLRTRIGLMNGGTTACLRM